ncbi:MAG: DUF6485 family protein [Spirochaetia bacterium]
MNCQNQKQNQAQCNCTYGGCPRYGVCCECITYHRRMNELPACYFNKEEERTYNRSISYFIRNRG